MRKPETIAVVGLGYVGLPLAVVFAEAGFDVTGIDPWHPLRPAIPEKDALQRVFREVRRAVKEADCTRAIGTMAVRRARAPDLLCWTRLASAQVIEPGAPLDFPDARFDTVTISLTLCTVPDPAAAGTGVPCRSGPGVSSGSTARPAGTTASANQTTSPAGSPARRLSVSRTRSTRGRSPE